MVKDQRRHVGNGELLGISARRWIDPTDDQCTERVAARQGAVAPTADVGDAAPIDELDPGAGGDEHVACLGAMER